MRLNEIKLEQMIFTVHQIEEMSASNSYSTQMREKYIEICSFLRFNEKNA
jgi:hypothetical protein